MAKSQHTGFVKSDHGDVAQLFEAQKRKKNKGNKGTRSEVPCEGKRRVQDWTGQWHQLGH